MPRLLTFLNQIGLVSAWSRRYICDKHQNDNDMKKTMYLSDATPIVTEKGNALDFLVQGFIWHTKPDLKPWRTITELEIEEDFTVTHDGQVEFDAETEDIKWGDGWHPITWSHDGEYITVTDREFMAVMKKT